MMLAFIFPLRSESSIILNLSVQITLELMLINKIEIMGTILDLI